MRHPTLFVDNFQEISVCGHKMLSFEGGVYEKPFNIIQADGEHNLENCEGCKTQHNHITERIKVHQKKFPNCCDGHKKAHQLKIFNISDFIGLEKSIADKVMFTYHHFLNHLDNDDYFEDFVNYFDYVVESFGSFPNGYGSPFQINNFYSFLIDLITHQKGHLNSDKISNQEIEKRIDIIIFFINKSFKPINSKIKTNINRDFNLLLSTYDKWYSTFPFELSYFKHLKEKFSKSIPILSGKPLYNKYSGQSKLKLTTKEELTKFLIGLTKSIITNINGLKLYEKGLLSDSKKIKLELIIHNRQLELNVLETLDNIDRKEYIKALRYWFSTEKKFIDEISPLLINSDDTKEESKNPNLIRPNRTDLAYFIYYMESTKNKILVNTFPSDKAWKELGKKYNKNGKNIQVIYNTIFKDNSKRLEKSKINNISFVIDNMLNDFETAKKLAIDELKLAEINS